MRKLLDSCDTETKKCATREAKPVSIAAVRVVFRASDGGHSQLLQKKTRDTTSYWIIALQLHCTLSEFLRILRCQNAQFCNDQSQFKNTCSTLKILKLAHAHANFALAHAYNTNSKKIGFKCVGEVHGISSASYSFAQSKAGLSFFLKL